MRYVEKSQCRGSQTSANHIDNLLLRVTQTSMHHKTVDVSTCRSDTCTTAVGEANSHVEGTSPKWGASNGEEKGGGGLTLSHSLFGNMAPKTARGRGGGHGMISSRSLIQVTTHKLYLSISYPSSGAASQLPGNYWTCLEGAPRARTCFPPLNDTRNTLQRLCSSPSLRGEPSDKHLPRQHS
mmetsp:Transcript_42050/g.50972  ORF Transcript_42050/g.50972 Transcript_42050/m.50972 type:complete len:182 (+) Transcript_42050:145-690(+)